MNAPLRRHGPSVLSRPNKENWAPAFAGAQTLKRNVVVEVGVERRRLRTLLALRAAAASSPEIVAVTSAAE